MGKSASHPGYVKMEDTPWISQGRQIADVGGQGILSNYNKVNVFDEGTKASLDARNNAIYNRAFEDASRMYKDTMNKYNAANYNQFGTLNATAPAYRTDEYQRQFQRQLNDLAYNKAVNYENLINNELQRRYNTLDMYRNLYSYGQTPYELDLKNWNIENTNRDIAYQNALAGSNSGLGKGIGGINGGTMGALTGNPMLAMMGAQAGSNIGGMI